MNRTTWLQDRRMQKFRDVLSRWERKELSAMERLSRTPHINSKSSEITKRPDRGLDGVAPPMAIDIASATSARQARRSS